MFFKKSYKNQLSDEDLKFIQYFKYFVVFFYIVFFIFTISSGYYAITSNIQKHSYLLNKLISLEKNTSEKQEENFLKDTKIKKHINPVYKYNNFCVDKNHHIFYGIKKCYFLDITDYIKYVGVFLLVFTILFIVFILCWEKELEEKLYMLNKEKTLNLQSEQGTLENKIITTLAENFHHEIKTPLASLRLNFSYLMKIINILLDGIQHGDLNDLQILLKPKCNISDSCETCSIKDCENRISKEELIKKCINPDFCRMYYNIFNKNIYDEIIISKKVIESSLSSINNTIEISQSLKTFKRKHDVNVYEVFVQAFKTFQMLNKYHFSYKISPELKRCYLNGLNSDTLLNISINLIKNSLEAQAKIIEVKYVKNYLKNNHEFIDILIIDNGNGIPDEAIDTIFKLNFSTKSSSKSSKSTRGVGLSLTKQLLNYYNGDIQLFYTSTSINSDNFIEPSGTIFKINLPVKHCQKESK